MSDGILSSWTRRWGAMPRSYWIVLGVTSVLLYGCDVLRPPPLTYHEVIVAGVAKQMLQTGIWSTRWVGDQIWLEKPPLTEWIAALFIALFGSNEMAVRLPSLLCGTGIVLIVAGLAARWFGPRIGLLAGLIQATVWYMVRYSTLAEADIELCLVVTAAIAMFVRIQSAEAVDARALARLRLMFWTLVGVSTLLKGPIFGAPIILVACGGWILWQRSGEMLRRLMSPWAIGVAIAIALAWPAIVLSAGHGDALMHEWRLHFLARIDSSIAVMNHEPFHYYLTTVPWQLLPWTPLLVIEGVPSLRRAFRDRESPERLLWCWSVLPVVMLSLPPSKHHHYIIHALPGFAPIMALGFVRVASWVRAASPFRRKILAGAEFAIAGAALVVAAAAAPKMPHLRADIWLLGGIIAAGTAMIAVVTTTRRFAAATGMVLTLVAVLTIAARLTVVYDIDPRRAETAYLVSVANDVPPSATLIGAGELDVTRLVFYVRRPLVGVWHPNNIAAHIGPAPEAYVLARSSLAPLLAPLGEVAMVSQGPRVAANEPGDKRYALFRVRRPDSGDAP